MIHNTSKDPVLIKKIPLKVWRLKDEINSVIKRRLEVIQDNNEFEVTDLAKEYQRETSLDLQEETDELTPLEDLDTGEDEMAKALAEAEGTEDAPSDEVEDHSDEKDQAIPKNQIIQRKPNLNEKNIFLGRSILGEISMDNMYLFCNEEFLQGESIVIDFLIPNRFVLNAEVVFCRSYNMRSRIIGANRLPFRVGIKFTFLKTGERTLLRQFIHSIEPEIEAEPEKSKPKKEEEDDDEFSDLDDLDL